MTPYRIRDSEPKGMPRGLKIILIAALAIFMILMFFYLVSGCFMSDRFKQLESLQSTRVQYSDLPAFPAG